MSKLIKILSLKSTKEVVSYGVPRIRFSEYTNTLSEKARQHPGFVSSNSYWKNSIKFPEDKETCSLEIVSISEWRSLDDWEDWYKSKSRQDICNLYKDIIGKESFDIMNKRSSTEDTFLL